MIATILAWIIVTIIGLLIAPCMTIGIIFLNAGWGLIGDGLGGLFILLGVIHMFYKICN